MASRLARLLRYLASPSGGEPAGAPEELAPEELHLAARAFGLVPLLFRRLSRERPPLPSPLAELAARLKPDCLAAAGRAERSYVELGRVLEHLDRAGVATIVLKGPHLAELVYRDRAVRPVADFDLLVREESMPAMPEIMGRLGYAPYRAPHFDADRQFNCDLTFLAPGAKPVEIHWALEIPSAPFTIDRDGLWERSRPAVIGGAPTRVLAVEDLVLHVAIHAAFHHRCSNGPMPLLDLAEVFLAAPPDWELLAKRAVSWRADRVLHLMLAVLERCTGCAAPERVVSALTPRDFDPRLVDLAAGRMLEGKPAGADMTFHLAHVMGGRGLASRLGTLLAVLFPPPAFLAARYGLRPGSPRVFLRYPVRLGELCRRYSGTLIRNLAGGRETRREIRREADLNRLVAYLCGSDDYPYHHI